MEALVEVLLILYTQTTITPLHVYKQFKQYLQKSLALADCVTLMFESNDIVIKYKYIIRGDYPSTVTMAL